MAAEVITVVEETEKITSKKEEEINTGNDRIIVMATRVCPTCLNKLAKYDNYFCTRCGNALSEELKQEFNNVKTREYSAVQPLFSFDLFKKQKIEQPEENIHELVQKKEEPPKEQVSLKAKKTREFNQKTLVSLLVVIILSSVLFIILYMVLNLGALRNKNEEPIEESTYLNVITTGLDLEESTFMSDDFIQYIPYETDVYIEGTDLHSILKDHASAAKLKLNPNIYNSLNEILDKRFAIFSTTFRDNKEWFILLTPKDLQLATQELDNLEHDYLKHRFIGEKLVVSTNILALDFIESVYNDNEKNLALNPQYVTSRSKVPPSGQMLVIYTDANQATESLENVASQNKASTIEEIVNKILSTSFSELVLRK